MSFHFISHPWSVREVEDGILVSLAPSDLDQMAVSVFVDEVMELGMENGLLHVYLDFAAIHQIGSVMIGKVLAIHQHLIELGGRVIVFNLQESVAECFAAAGVGDTIEIRGEGDAPTLEDAARSPARMLD